MHTVLKSFPFSSNGIKSRTLAVGETLDFGKLTQGLIDGGWIGVPGAPPPIEPGAGAPAQIPTDWRDQHHTKQIALAKTFDDTVSTKAEAIVVLEAQEKAISEAAADV